MQPIPAAPPLLRRRALLAAAPALAAGGASAPDWGATLAGRVAALGGPGLLASYDVSGADAFDQAHANCAYVYDNALVGLALLGLGHHAAAQAIGEALRLAQAHDRFYTDGRLRNAYRAGPAPTQGAYALPGWWDAQAGRWLEDGYQAGSATGVVAWAMILWAALYRQDAGEAFRAAGLRAAGWVATQRAARGYAGGFVGFEPAPQPQRWVSTEHNIDLVAAFRGLGLVGAPLQHAADFVQTMWLPGEGRFAMGLLPDGAVNLGGALDANLWPLLLAPQRTAWQPALGWVLQHQGVPAGAPRGVDFNEDRDGIWMEGTAITALVCRGPQPALVPRFLQSLRENTAPGGLIYATNVARLSTGLSTGLSQAADFFYYRKPHIAPTAWAVMAQAGFNPLSLTT